MGAGDVSVGREDEVNCQQLAAGVGGVFRKMIRSPVIGLSRICPAYAMVVPFACGARSESVAGVCCDGDSFRRRGHLHIGPGGDRAALFRLIL